MSATTATMHHTHAARRALLRGTALAASLLVSGPALAQLAPGTLPSVQDAGGATIDTTGTKMTVNLNAQNRIISYNSFNVASDSRVSFISGITDAPALSVLNRLDANRGASIIEGGIESDPNIAVWLINPDGITFGKTGSFSGGSLLVSTLPLDDSQIGSFLAGTLTNPRLAGLSKGGISFEGGTGKITAIGSVVAVAQAINVGKEVTSSAGSVALVAATDVTFTSGINSPLGITINRGTTLAVVDGDERDGGIDITGKVTGQSLRVVGGVDRAITAALLNVQEGAELTATAANGSIVLATASVAASGGDVLVSNGTDAGVPLRPGIVSRGIVQASTPVTGGSATIPADVSIQVASAGDLTLGGLYSASGPLSFQAGSDVIGEASLVARTNSDGTGGGDLTIDANAGVGKVILAAGSQLIGGTAEERSDVRVRGESIALGDVTALSLRSIGGGGALSASSVSVGNVAVTGGLSLTSTTGDLTTGNITAAGPVTLTATNDGSDTAVLLRTGNVAASGPAGGILLTALNGADVATSALSATELVAVSGEAVAVGAATSTGSDVNVTGSGPVTVGGNVSAAGNYTVAGQSVTLGTPGATAVQSAGGTVRIEALDGDLSGLGTLTLASGSGPVRLITDKAIAFGPTTTVNGGMGLSGEVIIEGAETLSLGIVNALRLRSADSLTTLTLPGTITLGNVQVADALRVVSTAGNLTVGNVGAVGAVALTVENADESDAQLTTGNITVSGTGGEILLTGLNDARVTTGRLSAQSLVSVDGGTVAVGSAESTSGDVVVTGSGSVSVTGPVSVGRDYLVTGATVTLGSASTTPVRQAAGRAVSIEATDGDLVGQGNLTLASGSGPLTLTTDRAITFAPTTVLNGGSNLSADVVIDGAESVALGDINARRLRSAESETTLTVPGDVTLGNVQVAGALLVTSVAGNLQTANVRSGSSIVLTAENSGKDGALLLRTGDLTAGGATGEILLSALNGADVTTSGLTAPGLIKVTGDRVTVGSASSATSDVSVTGTDAVTVQGTARAARDVVVTSGGTAAVQGEVVAGRDYAVTGAAVTLGNSALPPISQAAASEVRITATSSITSLGSLTLQSDSNNSGGEALRLTAPSIDLASATLNGGRFSAPVIIDGGQTLLRLGNVNALSLLSDGNSTTLAVPVAVSFGNVELASTLNIVTTNGPITADSITIRNAGDGLFLNAGGASGSISTGALRTNAGDIALSAANNLALASAEGSAASGRSVALLAGGAIGVSGGIVAAEDIALRAGTNASIDNLRAGDDIDITAGGAVSLGSARTDATGAGLRSIQFDPARAGTAAGISFGAASANNSNITISSASLTGPAISGSTDAGLVLGSLTAGNFDVKADRGDIRIGDLTSTSGNIEVGANAGSVSSLRDDWSQAAGGSTISAPGQVTFNVSGALTAGLVEGATVTNVASLPGSGSVRIREVRAGTLALQADSGLQVDTGTIAAAVTLRTTDGSAGDRRLDQSPLIAGYGRANLTAQANGSTIAVTAPGGAAQLGTLTAGTATGPASDTLEQIRVAALAVDVTQATANNGALLLTADRGLLKLDNGFARTNATLLKRGDVAALVAGTLTAGSSIAVQSTTNVQIGQAIAGTSLGVLAQNGVTAIALTATGGDVAVSAGGTVRLNTVRASDDISIQTSNAAGGDIILDSARALGSGPDSQSVLFNRAQIGQAGGLTFGAQSAADIGSNVTIGGFSLSGETAQIGDPETGLVVGALIGGTHQLNAATGDIRIQSLTATAGGIDIRAGEGSVAGRLEEPSAPVAAATEIVAPGRVTLAVTAAANVASVEGRNGISAVGETVRLATVSGSTLSVAAGSTAQVDAGTISGNVTLSTSAGGRTNSDLVSSLLVAGVGTAALSAPGSIAVDAAKGVVQLTSVRAGESIGVTAQALDIGAAEATRGALSLIATHGRLGLGIGSAGTTATLVKEDRDNNAPLNGANPDRLEVRTSVTGNEVVIRSQTDAVVASATATKAAVLLAGRDASAGTIRAEDVALSAGRNANLTTVEAIDNVALTAGTDLIIGSVTSSGGGTDNRTFVLTPANAASGTGIQPGEANGVDGNISALAGANLRLGSVSSAIGSAALTATRGDITGLAAADTTFGRGNVTASGAGRTITLRAEQGSIRLGTVSAGTGTTTSAGTQIDALAQAVDVATATAQNGALLLKATARDLIVDKATAGGTATLIKEGGTGGLTIQTGLTARGTITLESASAIQINGRVEALQNGSPETLITLSNTGTGTTTIGGTGEAAGFTLAGAEFDFLNAKNIVVASGARDVTIRDLTLKPGTATFLPAVRFLTTGAVTISGQIKGSGTGTLQIGGTATGEPSETVNAQNLARSITLQTASGTTSPLIDYASGTLDLRAQKIRFGGTDFITQLEGRSSADVALDVADPGSKLYNGDKTQSDYLKAKLLQVSYSDYALFQNIGGPAGGGVVLNDLATPNSTVTALQLFSTGSGSPNSFALFGKINGFVRQAAGILPNASIEIAPPSGATRVIRINQANSRVNGCVIGSPDKGCLGTDTPQPNLALYDPRQTQLFGDTDNAGLLFNPLVGRANEGLFVDIADAPVGIDTLQCEPDAKDCPRSEERK